MARGTKEETTTSQDKLTTEETSPVTDPPTPIDMDKLKVPTTEDLRILSGEDRHRG